MLNSIVFPQLTWTAVADILVVAFILYHVLVFIRGTRAVQMTVGLAIVVGLCYGARWLGLETLSWMLTGIIPYFVLVVVVLFQKEIRRGLAHLGQAPIIGGFSSINRNELYDEIVLAVNTLAAHQIGALIVIERDIGLKTYIESGIAIDAALSYDLLLTVFNPAVPLHDGAVIIQSGRIAAAACFLPLTVKPRLSKELGTRHRAAIGVTEETDAVAIIVSEENSAISFAQGGEIKRFLDSDTLRLRLKDALEHKASAHRRTVGHPIEHRLDS